MAGFQLLSSATHLEAGFGAHLLTFPGADFDCFEELLLLFDSWEEFSLQICYCFGSAFWWVLGYFFSRIC